MGTKQEQQKEHVKYREESEQWPRGQKIMGKLGGQFERQVCRVQDCKTEKHRKGSERNI